MRANMNTITRGILGATMLAALAGCGSGLGTTSSTTGSGGTGSATSGTAKVELGSGSGTSFQNGVLKIQVTKLAAGGTTGVTANIVDANNANSLFTAQSVVVNFTSICVSAGTATIDASVTTLTGTASAAYTAAGCTSDTITATATIGTTTLTATGKLTVQPASLGSLIFEGPAVPSEIGLAGMGGVTSSKVTFELLDTNGNPVPDVTVSFSTDTTVGGIQVLPATSQTQSDGTASTFIQAGTAHTVVHVTATAISNGITKSGGSTGVTISTGVPTERNFTLVASTHNVEGANVFLGTNVSSTLTVGLGDRYANPVPDTTQVSFTTNGGNIDSVCSTTTVSGVGQCHATWVSTANVPTTGTGGIQGHAHILAYTTGEEHFTDTNGDGVFDDGDTFTPFLSNAGALDYFYGVGSPPQDDMGNPYADWNENGHYTAAGGETFASATSNTARHAPDGKWYGVSCGGLGSTATNVTAKDESGTNQTVQCGGTTIVIGKEECIVMGTSTYFAMDPTAVNASIGNTATPTSVSVAASPNGVTYYILDSNGDVPAEGTIITLTTTGLVGVTASFPGASGTQNVPDLPGACLTGSQGAIPSSGNALPFKGYPVTVLLTIPSSSVVPVAGSFSISMKTPVTLQNEAGITVTVTP
jgi:hypothetical protein